MHRFPSVLILLFLSFSQSYSQGLFETLTGSFDGNQQNYELSGYFRSYMFGAKDPDNGNIYLQGIYAEPSLVIDIRKEGIGRGHSEIRYKVGNEWGNEVGKVDVREAYGDMYLGPVDLRIGKQVISWGKSMVFNITSRFTPLKPAERSPEEDDLKKSVWALVSIFHPWSFLDLSIVWQPLFEPTDLLVEYIPLPSIIEFGDPDFPGVEIRSTSYGIKTDFITSAVDFSISWFDGNNHWPGLSLDMMTLDDSNLPEIIQLQMNSYRIRSLGTDFALPLGSWLLRGESSYTKVKGFPEKDYMILPELSYSFEIEHTIGDITLLAGYYGKWISGYEKPVVDPILFDNGGFESLLSDYGDYLTPDIVGEAVIAQISVFNRQYNYQLREFYHTLFFVPRLTLLHESLTIRIPLIFNITSRELLLKPAMEYIMSDDITVYSGFSYMGGGEGSLYNLVGPVLNGIHLSFKYSF